MTAVDLEAMLRTRLALEAERAERQGEAPAATHLMDFCEATFPGYQRAPHVERVAEELEAIERGENDRLMIFMPPRHGKSELVSIRFPAWYLCRNPDRAVIAASYGDLLTSKHGRWTRDLMTDDEVTGMFPGHPQLRTDTKAVNYWLTTAGGRYLGTTIGGQVTGHGADLFIIDDPIKNRPEASSATYRESMWQWYTAAARTRLEPGGAIVLMHTRWHEDDLAGRLLEAQPGRWRVVSIPAIDDEGNACWPERYPIEALQEIRQDITEREFAPQYQQRPAPEEGDIFKWFPRYTEPPKRFEQIVVGLDTAYTETASSDYTAWTAWGYADGRAYWLEAGRVRLETPEATRHVTSAVWRLQQRYARTALKVAYRERVAIDRVAAQHLRRGVPIRGSGNGSGQDYAGLPVVGVKLPGGNTKEELGRIVSVDFEGGRAVLPEHAPNLDDWIEEHKVFPHGLHDDWVETTIVPLWYLFRRQKFRTPTTPIMVYEGAAR